MPRWEAILPINGGWITMVIDEPIAKPKALFLLCHGLTGDRCGPQRILTQWAKNLAENGYLVLRFDFRGSGDSYGSFSKTTFSNMEEDVEAVLAWSRTQFSFPALFLAGLSLGAIPIVMVSPRHKDCKGIFLLSSDVIDGPEFSFPSYPVPIRNGQFFLHKTFYEERSGIWPRNILRKNLFPTYLFYGADDDKVCKAAKELEKIKIHSIAVWESDHLFESLKARNFVLEKMVEQSNQIIGQL